MKPLRHAAASLLALATLGLPLHVLAQPAAGAGPAQPATGAAPAPQEVQAPHYGATLFDFFQGRHFEAVTELMASQHFRRIGPHDGQAEVLRGGLLLSWGLHQEAGAVFERLLAEHAPPAVRDRAWFYLAKIRYQRGLPAQAEAALERIASALPAELQEERVLLRARLLMARADHAGAAALLGTLPAQAGAVARFNLGVALVNSGQFEPGMAQLDAIGRRSAADEEQRALRDRANVALGFAALRAGLAADAHRYLQRVRLEGPDSGKALLGYGWAALELGEPRHALVPWGELLVRPVSDAAAVEAQIAVPYALAEIGASSLALDRYQQAIASFEIERRDLDESIAAIRAGRLVATMLERNPRVGMGWFGGLERLPQMPHAGHLAPVLASHEFQEAFKNLNDVIFLGRNLEDWQGKLQVFRDMLDNRRQAFAERVPRIRAQAGATDLAGLELRRASLASELAAEAAGGVGAALASPRERIQREQIERGRAAAASIGAGTEAELARERLRRVAGALTWQQARLHPQRLWEAQKALRDTEQALTQARQRDAALLRAQAEEPQRFAAFAARIAAVQQRIAELLPRVAALRGEQAAQLQEIAVEALVQQQDRLEVYSTQARLGIAQLHDRAQLAQRRPGERDEEAAR